MAHLHKENVESKKVKKNTQETQPHENIEYYKEKHYKLQIQKKGKKEQ